MRDFFLCTLLLLVVSCNPVQVDAKIKMAKLFTDHAVLQRNIPVPVWGWADPTDKIVVTFNEKTYRATPDSNGKWMVKLKAQAAGGPYKMNIAGQDDQIVLKDILVGDVWLCSGQSNMEWAVGTSNNVAEEMRNATDSKIRHFKIPRAGDFLPSDTLDGGTWVVNSPKTVGNFTAVGYFFARDIRKQHDIPIGLLNSSWGGSRIEPWMSPESNGYASVDQSSVEIKAYLDSIESSTRAFLHEKIGNLPGKDLGMDSKNRPVWASAKLDDSNWKTIELPNIWEAVGYERLDGIVWFRKTITLSEKEAQSDMTLGLAMIDDADLTFINGKAAGKTQGYNIPRSYKIPARLLKTGENVIAIRVEDTGGGGGFHGAPNLLFYETAAGRTSLAGEWKFQISRVDMGSAFQQNQIETLLYHKMIHPILNFPIKGALWYQGESNAGWENAIAYREQFPEMIKDWRKRWNIGDFPFYWVQLANYQAAVPEPGESTWALLREAQNMTLKLPNTAQAVIIDIGEADDIHPRNKQDVGWRLALAARKFEYGEDLVYSGPQFQSMEAVESTLVLSFDHVGSGIFAKGNDKTLQGFAIAGADHKFYWAKATIVDDKVIVSHPKIKSPVAVRYAWADNPDKANLYNREGLPASPFRTDDWKIWETWE